MGVSRAAESEIPLLSVMKEIIDLYLLKGSRKDIANRFSMTGNHKKIIIESPLLIMMREYFRRYSEIKYREKRQPILRQRKICHAI